MSLLTEEEIFSAALHKSTVERAAFLDRACQGDTLLRASVEALLAAYDVPDSFLDAPLRDATIDQPVLERPGMSIGPYKLLEQIGEGGFGVVFMAEQLEPVRRKVALKVIKPGMDTRQVIARFEAERQALAAMDHPNIAKVFDAGTTAPRTKSQAPNLKQIRKSNAASAEGAEIGASDSDIDCDLGLGACDLAAGRPYFVMELVRGIPITQYCDEKHLTLRQRLELFLPVCQAIQHAHQKGLIHRDIKPTNILVAEYDDHPVPKVIDFGVAKATGTPMSEKTLFTGFGQIVGTLQYMSPEQAKVNQLDIDTRSDIYSLGVLVYELLTGSTPLDPRRLRSAAFDEMLRIIREVEPPKPSTKLSSSATLPSVAANRSMELPRLSRSVRGELDWIVMKALEKDRDRRYETANSFAQDLQRYLANEPVQACPPSTGYRMRKFIGRNRGLVLASALVLLTLVAGIVGTTWGMIRAEYARRDAVAAQVAEAKRAAGERRAKEETQKRLAQVEKGTEILASVFRGLDSMAAVNSGVTASDLLGRRLREAARQLEGEAVGDPLSVARLQQLLGILLRERGHPEQAEGLLVKASRTQERLLGADDANTVETKHDLAMLYHLQGKHALAEALYKEVLASRTAKLGADDLFTVCTQYDLAMLYRDMKEVEQAIPLLEEAVKRCKAAGHHLTLGMQASLGAIYCGVGRFADAIPPLEEVHEKGRKRPELAWVGKALLTAYVGAGKRAEAVALATELVRAAREQFPARSLDLAAALHSLGQALIDVEANADAEPLYQEVLAIRIARLGADHSDTILPRDGLARIYRSLKKPDRSITLLEESLRLRMTELDRDHPEILARRVTLGGCYCDAGRFEEGLSLIEEVRRMGRDDPHPAWVRTVLLTAYVQAGRTAEATSLVAERVQEARQRFAAGSPALAAVLADNGKVLLDAKACVEAEALLLEAYQGLKNERENEHLRNVLEAMVKLFAAWGKPEEEAKWRSKLVEQEM